MINGTKVINRCICFDEMSIDELKQVRASLRSPSDSHTIRELIKKAAEKLPKKESA